MSQTMEWVPSEITHAIDVTYQLVNAPLEISILSLSATIIISVDSAVFYSQSQFMTRVDKTSMYWDQKCYSYMVW